MTLILPRPWPLQKSVISKYIQFRSDKWFYEDSVKNNGQCESTLKQIVKRF